MYLDSLTDVDVFRVLSVVSAEVVPPFPDRPTEGFLQFNAEFSPMANPSFEVRWSLCSFSFYFHVMNGRVFLHVCL